jgi:hypothetical protein
LSHVYPNEDGSPKKLERVNNTETTTTQDYLGTYLPSGTVFLIF